MDLKNLEQNSKSHTSYYDEIAANYDTITASEGYSIAEAIESKIRSLNFDKKIKALDIGIGTGLTSQFLSDAGHEVHGIDGSSKMLEICRRKGISKNLLHHKISEENIGINDTKFDLIICTGVLETIATPRKLIKSILQYLHSNGFLILTIRDKELNPHFGVLKFNGHEIDKDAFTSSNVTIYNHSFSDIDSVFTELNTTIIESRNITAYYPSNNRPPVMNRLITARQS